MTDEMKLVVAWRQLIDGGTCTMDWRGLMLKDSQVSGLVALVVVATDAAGTLLCE